MNPGDADPRGTETAGRASPAGSADRSQRRRRLAPDFWWVFAASTCLCLVSGTATPQLARFARVRLGAPVGLVGVIVGSAAIGSILLRPWFGRLADRYGRRRIAVAGSAMLATGAIILLLSHDVASGTAGRMILGLSSAAANTAMMAWTLELAAPADRGRAFSLFGVSVWIGYAIGPPVGQELVSHGGYSALWCGCGVMGLAAAGCLLATSRDPRVATDVVLDAHREHRSDGLKLLKLVLAPGLASSISWAAEGVVLAFLAIHLEHRGLPAGGLTGASSVFTVFALTVISSRLALARLVDSLGPRRTAVGALATVGAGLGVLALASSFGSAAAGAVLLGLGFAPLYPALTMLATIRLPDRQRAHGIGIFAAFQDAGIAAGSALGGLIIAWSGTEAALLAAAAAQLLAVGLVLAART